VGLNPYRAFDSTYAGFIELVAGQIAASLASARAYDAELRRAEQLEKLDRAKTTFFSNVSHELRTPLTLLLGPLDDVLRNPAVSPDVRPELDLAHRNALRLLKLVNTLLDFSRIEAGRVEAVYEPTDLVTFTAELASNFRSAMERGGIRLLISADTDATPESGARAREAVYVDREMWEKIVLNLLSNAFKHTFEGEVAVTVVDRADHAELVVRDTGVGIPASEIPHLFERFRRVPNARSRTHEGTGIGLALVQELVRLHGGSISVESEEGVGTTFRVRVPRGTAHLPAERIGAARLQSSTAVGSTAFTEQALRWLPDLPAPDEIWDELPDTPPAATPSVDVPGRILLADDNADMREYASRLLRSRGWEVEAVPDGQAALDALQRVRPDLVLSDVMMPRLDGFGLLRAMRASPATRDVPLILLSARAGEESRVEGLDAGADDYLVKPFSARELVARVGAHLTLARLRAQALAEVEAARAALEVANAQLQTQAAELEMQAEQLRVTVEELARRTEEAEHHRRVAESAEAHLRTTFDQAPVAIAVLRGPDHRFVLANPRYLDLVDRRPVTGCPIRAALPELEGQGVFELLDRVYSTSTPYVGTEFRAELVDPATGERREVFVNFVYQPLVAPDGDVEGIAVVATDVTTLVQSRRVAEAAQRDAEEANRAKSEFLAAMSHELRTPLNAIAGHAQLMEMEIHGPITPEQRAALARVQQSEQHLLSLINDVLNFAKLEAGRVEFDLDDVTLGDAVGHVVAMIEPQFIARELVCDIDVADGIVVRADDEKLRQILLNLLSNAVKFTGPGGRITIEATVDSGAPPSTGDGVLAPGLVRLDVTDTGVGIPDDRQRAIFEPFVQVHRQRTESTSGTGLGLTISRDLARGMGGDLTVDSTVGVGSTFTLTLPLGGAHAPADRAVSRTAARE
jgi:signal transduction histidine kinase/DNA-binding response OmpR family regulator